MRRDGLLTAASRGEIEAMDSIFANLKFSDALLAMGDLILPRACAVCGRRLHLSERHICLECLCDLPLTHFWERSHNPMADQFNDRIRSHVDEGEWEPYAFGAALFYYNSESLYRLVPQALKYHGDIAAGRFFAAMLGEKLASSEQFAGVDLVAPVPLHWRRSLSRGFNQADVLARVVAAALGARYDSGLLRRARYSASQTRVPVEKKASNVLDAFKLRHVPDAGHILLVDDTFTTGATLASCHKALRAALPPSVRISVATLAFVGS